MRWAILDICEPDQSKEDIVVFNWGDYLQILAIENLYKKMGIDLDSVIRIPLKKCQVYDGEDVILPVNIFINWNPDESGALFSAKIHPVFLGASLSFELDDKLANWLKKYQPIGCRDEYTYRQLMDKKIDAYLFGCLTITLPIANRENEAKKIFAVDPPKWIVNVLPEDIRKRASVRSNIFCGTLSELQCEPKEYATALYNDLIAKAEMVITSRLHIALPCIAAGIPVFFCVDEMRYTYSILENFIQIYTEDNANDIDWEAPNKCNITENLKMHMLDLASARLKELYYRKLFINEKNILNSNNIAKKDNCITPDITLQNRIINALKGKFSTPLEYTLWGITPHAKMVYKVIKNNFKNAHLVGVFDTFKTGEFLNINIQHPREIAQYSKNVYHIVCGYRTIYAAQELFQKLNIDFENVLFLDKNDIRVDDTW